MRKVINILAMVCFALFALPSFAYVSGTPVPTDSRIKTFVYNANDVYRILTHYGYQMNIEFGEDEEILTISVGDRSGWQITPDDNRIFIRSMADKAHTNMTIVTTDHTYQFDLYSDKPGENGWDELVYVVRFYYPSANEDRVANNESSGQFTAARHKMEPAAPPFVPNAGGPIPNYNSGQPPMYGSMVYNEHVGNVDYFVRPPLNENAARIEHNVMLGQQPSLHSNKEPLLDPMLSAPNVVYPVEPSASFNAPSQMLLPMPSPVQEPFGMIAAPDIAVVPPVHLPNGQPPFMGDRIGHDPVMFGEVPYYNVPRQRPFAPSMQLPHRESFAVPRNNFHHSNSIPMALPLTSHVSGGYAKF